MFVQLKAWKRLVCESGGLGAHPGSTFENLGGFGQISSLLGASPSRFENAGSDSPTLHNGL